MEALPLPARFRLCQRYALITASALDAALDRLEAAREEAARLLADVHAWCELAEGYAVLIAGEMDA